MAGEARCQWQAARGGGASSGVQRQRECLQGRARQDRQRRQARKHAGQASDAHCAAARGRKVAAACASRGCRQPKVRQPGGHVGCEPQLPPCLRAIGSTAEPQPCSAGKRSAAERGQPAAQGGWAAAAGRSPLVLPWRYPWPIQDIASRPRAASHDLQAPGRSPGPCNPGTKPCCKEEVASSEWPLSLLVQTFAGARQCRGPTCAR